MLLLNKVLPLIVLPLGISLILLAWGLARRRRAVAVAGLCVLLVSSNPLVGNALIRWTEHGAERRVASALPIADAIVVLSAGRVVAPGPGRVSEWGDANRFFGGLELFQAGRAPLLVFTDAMVWWEPDAPQEGAILAAFAQTQGVPADRIAVTGRIGNTADEAIEVAQLLRGRGLGQPHVILVTSAFHMPRARQQFEELGLAVEPFPVDFWLSDGTRRTLLDVLPSVSALRQTESAVRELYGRGFYWLKARLPGLR
jgi:uncharacterized SAM-binding protein YcdF (DUF218 family)